MQSETETQAVPDTSGTSSTSTPATPPPAQIDPVWHAIQACAAGQFDEALPFLKAVVENHPDHVPALMALGAAHGQLGMLRESKNYFDRVVEADPKSAQAFSNLGNVLKLMNDLPAAVTAYRRAITLQPGLADAHYNLATLLLDIGDLEEAEKSLERALLFRPAYSEAHNNLGDLHMRRGKVEIALSHFRQALVWNQHLPQAQANLVLALYRLGLYEEGEAVVNTALAERPDDTQVLMNQAMGLLAQGRTADAEAIYRGLIERFPEEIGPWVNLGGVLQIQQRYEEAAECYRKAMTLKGVNASLCLASMAGLWLSQDQPAKAIEELKHAVMLESRHAGVLANLGWAMVSGGDAALGVESIRRAVALAPQLPELRSNLIYGVHFDPALTPEKRFETAREWNTCYGDPKDKLPIFPLRQFGKGDRLRLGIVSGDLRNHSVATCLEPLFEHLDHDRIELSCYYTSGQQDAVTERLKRHADLWRAVAPLSYFDLAQRIRRDGIDILIDLSWHTGGNRLAAFALKPAPVQASWLGFFATTGLDAIDFRLSDAIMDPPGQTEAWHSEQLIRMPTALTFRPPADAPAIASLPASRTGKLTYASVSKYGRINARVLDAWARVLHAQPDTRLIVFTGIDARDGATLERARRQFAMHELDEDRIDIRPRLPLTDFLAALTTEADVVLDTFPYCGGVGTLYALWMGLPTVTLAGPSSYERTGASVMTHAGLGHWVATEVDAFVAIASHAGEDLSGLTRLRESIRTSLRATPLLDGRQFARSFETALFEMWEVALAAQQAQKQETTEGSDV